MSAESIDRKEPTSVRTGVVGTGHVGLVTAVALSSLGHEVVGTDSDDEKIARLKDGEVPFFEPGVQELLTQEMESGRLTFTTSYAEAVPGAEAVLISVGTPTRASGEANLIAVEHAARDVARHATGRVVVVEKSTVPTGTAKRLRSTLHRERPDLADDLEVACNPEFLREGRALEDSLRPDRILVGAESETAFATMRRLYKPLTERGCELIETDISTAELTKHASNAFLALKISFANALARLCERSGADVEAVTRGMGKDPRIGPDFLRAGLGYGGSCFPKDLAAFERVASKLGYPFPMLREVARINEEAIDAALDKVREALWNLEGKRIALFGLAFKPGTDDIRFAPALTLARRLLAEGAHIVGFDPVAGEAAKAELSDIELADDVYAAATGAHCVVLCTEWPEFSDLDLTKLKEAMAYPVIVDGRNFLSEEAVRTAGFTYYPTGKAPIL
ncbi:MAG: UDP-glucose/GDP-mannose dehydrogenase family protein [Actinomycetota bacterium]|nr:UDP-glucose/GDP-mannose dehydrogenase family protein [Actinomycetota bacterium]